MRKTVLTFMGALLVAITAFGDVIDDWHRDQAAIEAMLQQKHYAEARKASIKLINRMFDRLGANADASRLLAQTVALRAAAEDGLGSVDDTNWYRQVAKALDAQVVLPPMTTQLPQPIDVRRLDPSPPIDLATAKVEAPQRTRKRDPERPAIVNALGEAIVELEVAIDVDGMVRQPRIVSSPAPTVSYAALEAIKQWRFKPGRMGGKPVPVVFRITFNFH
jgi:TonB family protein